VALLEGGMGRGEERVAEGGWRETRSLMKCGAVWWGLRGAVRERVVRERAL